MIRKIACLFILSLLLVLPVCKAQEVTMTFAGETLSEALRRMDQAQNDKRILFLPDDLELYTITAVIDRMTVAEAVRKICSPYPVSVTEFGDNLFVEYVPKNIHLPSVVINGEQSSLAEIMSDSMVTIRYLNVMREEALRVEQGMKSVSVVRLLSEKGLNITDDYQDVTYDPCSPSHEGFYAEEDYGSVENSIKRLEHNRKRRCQPSGTHVFHGSSVNGRPMRWSIKVPKDFPAKIYDREITYTKDVDIKYVKSVYVFDYNPVVRPYAVVLVQLRSADEIR